MEIIKVKIGEEEYAKLVHGANDMNIPLQQYGNEIRIAAKPKGTISGNHAVAIGFDVYIPNCPTNPHCVQAVTTLSLLTNAIHSLEVSPLLK